MATLNFNANEVEPNAPREPLPAGKYPAEITASELKPTKSGNGQYLELEFTVIDGPCKGRKVWDRLCLDHPNAQTVRIARGTLSAICRAVGIMHPIDSVELHNLPLIITVACKHREDNGEITNEIKGYAKREAPATPQPVQPATDGPVPAPWKRSTS
ncbi:MAG TPA: DUF669 domain-containing protein [Thermoguttaceae bacterium]|nr:DUF669 domain-containing protein [Thermoguttaceae bacterium]